MRGWIQGGLSGQLVEDERVVEYSGGLCRLVAHRGCKASQLQVRSAGIYLK